MGGRIRLAIARLWYEGNSFNPVPVGLAHFRAREWVSGEEAVSFYAGTATEMGGVLGFLADHPEWDGRFLRCASASPGGPVVQEDLDSICDEIVDGIASGSWDAVYLSLHGALLGTGDLAPERRLLERVRATVGPSVPVAATFDMHACLDPAIGGLVNVLTGYRTYPHVDMDQTARRALVLLDKAVRGEIRPAVTLVPVPMLPASHGMRTDSGPMAELVALAAAEEDSPVVYDATVFGGFAYADSPNAHSTVSLCHERGANIDPVARRLVGAALERHERFGAELPGASAGIAEARRLLERGAHWPVAVLEPSDNPLSGGLGDTTGLFRALVEGVGDLPAVFAFFHDSDLVARAHELGEGAAIEVELGGRIAPVFGAPVPFSGRVARLTDGRFTNAGPMDRGLKVNFGRTAVLERGELRVVVAETCQGVYDPAWFALHGIDLAAVAIVAVKAKNHFRAAFFALTGAIVEVDTPGPAPADLSLLDYRHVPRHYLAAAKRS